LTLDGRTPSVDQAALPERFSAAMNAATSRYGVLCDIPIAFVTLAAIATLAIALVELLPGLSMWLVAIASCLPILVCVGAHLALRNARGHVLSWLRSLPFPVENVNAVLCGAGEFFEIHLSGETPDRSTVMSYLERSSEDPFVVEHDPDSRIIVARFGIMDSKRNPYGAAHRRYAMMKKVVALALVPMHDRYPITRVLIV